MSDASPHKTVLARQTHRKSRFGCLQCKRRRVKCGEEKPACNNCARRHMPCSYTSSYPASKVSSVPGNNDVDSTPSHSITSFDNSAASSPIVIDDLATSSLDTSRSTASLPFDLFDLELWNHWTTILRYSLTEDENGDIAWSQNVSQLAFAHTYIAQLILALSALHLSRTNESRRIECIARSNFLQSNAISGMMSVMESGNMNSNPNGLYVAACFLVFCSFGKGPQPGQYLVYSDEGEPEWLGLLQGVKSILSEHRRAIFPEHAPTQKPKTPAGDSEEDRVDPEEVFTGYSEQFAALRKSIETLEAEDSSFSKYLRTLDDLKDCYSAILQKHPIEQNEAVPGPCHHTKRGAKMQVASIRVRNHPGIGVISHHAFAWIFRCNQDYLSSVQTRRPMALVLLAHHCVLLALLKDIWYMDGWVPHIVEAIKRDLHPSYQHWLDWPLRHLDHVYIPPAQ
ncbi:hypothetical protein CKM354_001145900 [Cercospora kikuchii]|uniref:Zn(2)-C6 fungal-type domain-containing protein n=1 Tax=Cercospora kikuchii TaxID=84275 RepID=A0A9P3CVK2_9PEZI|nr:uncharacterized protein CKM354_001145900 [Cercospora kikuchii]GIZ48397.1 hypothetical protein CKM354_001145900 [Cercospora kikuchii]